MTNGRPLLSLVGAAAVLLAGTPAGPGSDRAGKHQIVLQETTGVIAPGLAPEVTAELREPVAAAAGSWSCERDLQSGIAKRVNLRSVAGTLSSSGDAEHQLASAILRLHSDPKGGIKRMLRARQVNPAHPLIAMHLLQACSGHADLHACATGDAEKEAIRIDGSNGTLWAHIAWRRYQQGDDSGALRALGRAATAPRFDGYWIEHVKLFERAFAASTAASYTERVIAAIGVTAAMARLDFFIVKACTDKIQRSSEWRLVCGDFGKRLETDGETLMEAALGVALQAQLYGAIGDKKRHAMASRKQESLRAAMQEPFLAEAQVLLLADERVLNAYIAEFDTYGEVAAMQFLEKEIARLKALAGYDPCATTP